MAERATIGHVKVVTEAGVVYLMGVVTDREAEDAVEIARTTGGVRKVVKIFDYCTLGDDPCRPLWEPCASRDRPKLTGDWARGFP